MDNEQLKDFVLKIIPEAEIVDGPQFLLVTVPSDKLYSLAAPLKADPATSFNFLFCVTGVDWPQHMEVVYHLKSTVHKHSLAIKGKILTRDNPEIDSVCDLWPTAEFHEREVFDLYGINFKNHPDMRRLLLPDDWVGYPMRKDYSDPINIIEY